MFYFNLLPHRWYNAGADPGFQVRGGTLKKIAPSRGRRENIFGVFRVKNHDFTPKNHIFPILGGAREMFGVFHVKNHDFTPKKIIFLPILGGWGEAPGAPPPESAPVMGIVLASSKVNRGLKPYMVRSKDSDCFLAQA